MTDPIPSPTPVEPPPPGDPWTVLHLVRWSAQYLEGKGVERARLEAEHLLADALDLGRLDLYLQFDRPLTPEELSSYRARLLRRAKGEPLQYIRGRATFRELELAVDPRVLIPRPETEWLVEEVLAHLRTRSSERRFTALDIGTGSGAIALSLALEGPFRAVTATDLSPEALALAEENARGVPLPEGVELRWLQGESYAPLPQGERWDVIVSNPPYIRAGELPGLQPEVREWEPRLALVGGEDGLAVLRVIVEGAAARLKEGGLLALEVGADQGAEVASLIREDPRFLPPRIVRDPAGRERIVLASLAAE